MQEGNASNEPLEAPFDAVVIGAGHVGLATARELIRAGLTVTVLEREDSVGMSWRRRHKNLHLNSHRSRSVLPGLNYPKGTRSFPPRDQVVAYLEAYQRHEGVPVEFGVSVMTVDRVGDLWQVRTSRGPRLARHVVVATGRDRKPFIPTWPGLDTFRGAIRHSAHFGDSADYTGKKVLVIGAGNSGFDVMNHLSRVATAACWVSARSGPSIIPKRFLGISLQQISPYTAVLPNRVLDWLIWAVARIRCGDLTRHGLPADRIGAATRIVRHDAAVAQDEGASDAIREGRIKVMPAVERFEENAVVFADGRRIEPDVVIAATGYRADLDGLVGHLSVLDDEGFPRFSGEEPVPGKPGLWFVGMKPTLTGYFHEASRVAPIVARKIRADVALALARA